MMERAQDVSPTPGSITSLMQGMLGPSTDYGTSKMPLAVRRDEIITHIRKMQVRFEVLVQLLGAGPITC